MTTLIIITFVVFMLNIPFGYWRENVRRFSPQWFLAIHLPVPFIIALRLSTDLGFKWYTYVFLVSAFFIGQRVGSIIRQRMSRVSDKVSSCLVMDLIRLR